MNFLKLIFKIAIIAVLAFVVVTVVGMVRRQSRIAENARDAKYWSEAGFYLLKPEEVNNPKVAVMAPPNCPSDLAQRARALCSALNAAGVPCEIKSQLELTADNLSELERRKKFMDGVEDPLVLVCGWGKGNPTIKDVIAQYRAGSSK